MEPIVTDCTSYDHSNFEKSRNFWGLERKREPSAECQKCGRPEFMEWFRKLNWQLRDPAYWKQVFKDAKEQKVFFFRAVPSHDQYSWGIEVDPDKDPATLLRATRPDWARGDIGKVILERRYEERKTPKKEHDYGFLQGSIDREISRMTADLDCVDNIRFAAMNSRKDMRRYRAQQDEGCCGSHDEEVTIYGRKFMIGCNYGH